ncbi:hypothetical protein SASPL_112700 [Salvia splendens]|uniref:SAM domain-containing protein n=1 Tax=Salvia splendens TaxID=180675 RepID=A0A8X8YF02_SALSN|nr:uncharacterized protein LOC121801118 [Salvia splendens]KAG6428448.1 hypothetical protein SASPL_112700 [Salvia splendens]
MDWYAWLSQTNLDPSLVHEYGLVLVRNEVEDEDLPYFNHDFLLSLGITIAKHRLEILKICAKHHAAATAGLSRLVHKTRKLFARKLGFRRSSAPVQASPYGSPWSGALRRINGGGAMWSGPLDRRLVAAARPLDLKVHERVLYPNWSPMVVRQRQRERPGFVCGSPALSGPIDRLGLSPKVGFYRGETVEDGGGEYYAAQSLWSIMFQDMKPT